MNIIIISFSSRVFIVASFLDYAKVARAQTLVMSTLQVVCAWIYANYHYDKLSYGPFICVGLAVIFFHLTANTISEYRDFRKGIDDVHSPETKYRLVSGIVPPRHVLYIGISAFATAIIFGFVAVLIWDRYLLLIPGVLGAGIAFFYSEWPFGLKYKLLGELCVFLEYGPLLYPACVIALTGSLSLSDILFSLPFGLLTACVLLANNIRDFSFEAGKTKTLTTEFGLKISYILLFSAVHISFLLVPILIHLGIMTNLCFLAFLAYPIIIFSVKRIGSPKFIEVFGILQVAYSIIICIAMTFS